MPMLVQDTAAFHQKRTQARALAAVFRRQRALAVTALVLAFGMAAAGMSVKLAFDNTPGVAANAPEHWPEASSLRRSKDGRSAKTPVLLVFAHPLCSCTPATLNELAKVLAKSPVLPLVHVVIAPPPVAYMAEALRLWKRAAALPNTTVSWDWNGKEAAYFGAQTSGTVYLFDAGGNRLFQGGITASRGHEGANSREDALAASLGSLRRAEGPVEVFGCSLFGVTK
jgi:hypothetical protein